MAKDRTRHGRREVAERLRGVTEEELQYVFLEKILNSAVGECCFDDEGDIDNGLILNRLADLIDPTCEVRDDNPWMSNFAYVCNSCGEHFSTCDKPNYCPGCGARVMSDEDN